MDRNYIPSYEECLALVRDNECFYHKIEPVNGVNVASFTYRLASYGDFCKPGALNMRGITFDVDTGELLALPFHKFFNHGENPFTDPKLIETWTIANVREKVDGSLIYFFKTGDKLHAKTKFDCSAPQAMFALDQVEKNPEWKTWIEDMINDDWTPMFEMVGPSNRIVLPYNVDHLIYLGCRNMKTGKVNYERYLPSRMISPAPSMFTNVQTIIEYCQSSNALEEGFVVEFTNGEIVKYKTRKYVDLHHTLSSLTNEKNLASLILKEQLDDLFELIPGEYHDEIRAFETKVKAKYNHLLHAGNEFYEEYKGLTNKTYAIIAIDIFGKTSYEFSIAMNLKTGKFDEEKFIERIIANKFWED